MSAANGCGKLVTVELPANKTIATEGGRLLIGLAAGFALGLIWPSSWKRTS